MGIKQDVWTHPSSLDDKLVDKEQP